MSRENLGGCIAAYTPAGRVTLLRFSIFCPQVCGDFVELFEGGFELVDNFLGEDVKISNITTPQPHRRFLEMFTFCCL